MLYINSCSGFEYFVYKVQISMILLIEMSVRRRTSSRVLRNIKLECAPIEKVEPISYWVAPDKPSTAASRASLKRILEDDDSALVEELEGALEAARRYRRSGRFLRPAFCDLTISN